MLILAPSNHCVRLSWHGVGSELGKVVPLPYSWVCRRIVSLRVAQANNMIAYSKGRSIVRPDYQLGVSRHADGTFHCHRKFIVYNPYWIGPPRKSLGTPEQRTLRRPHSWRGMNPCPVHPSPCRAFTTSKTKNKSPCARGFCQLTQDDLGFLLDLSRDTIIAAEKGRPRPMGIAFGIAWIEFYGSRLPFTSLLVEIPPCPHGGKK